MSPLQKLFQENNEALYISNYEATSNPTTLFVGVKVQLSIVVANISKNTQAQIFTTNYLRSFVDERHYLFKRICYCPAFLLGQNFTRVYLPIEVSILKKLFGQPHTLAHYIGNGGKYVIFFRNMGNFFFKLAFLKEPKYLKDGRQVKSSTVSDIFAIGETERKIIVASINSSLFYYYWILFSDCYHLSKRDVNEFPLDIGIMSAGHQTRLSELCLLLSEELNNNAILQTETKKDGTQKQYQRYFPQPCKTRLDEIDMILAKHYGFDQEETDFVINYDIKYRMGKNSDGDEE